MNQFETEKSEKQVLDTFAQCGTTKRQEFGS